MDVHDNSCFNEIVLIDMLSCSTCPAVAAATVCRPLISRLYNGHGIYYKYTLSSSRCFTFIARDRRRRDTSNGCALSMYVSQQRQFCDFNSVDDVCLISGKEESSVGGKHATREPDNAHLPIMSASLGTSSGRHSWMTEHRPKNCRSSRS